MRNLIFYFAIFLCSSCLPSDDEIYQRAIKEISEKKGDFVSTLDLEKLAKKGHLKSQIFLANQSESKGAQREWEKWTILAAESGHIFSIMKLVDYYMIDDARAALSWINRLPGIERSKYSNDIPILERCSKKVYQLGREEPKYVGLKGYIKRSFVNVKHDKILPMKEQTDYIRTLTQIGPDKWHKGTEKLLANTEVEVVDAKLTHAGYGNYTGHLVIKTEDGKEHSIMPYDFTPTDYWNCPTNFAKDYNSFVGIHVGDSMPVTRQGEWGSFGDEKRVFCRSYDQRKKMLKCIIYRHYRLGYGGIEHSIPINDIKFLF